MGEPKTKQAKVLVAAPTPFDERGDLDLEAFRGNVARWLEAGVDGILALGSTGEAVHLDDDEAVAVLEAARGAVPEGRTLMAGAARQSTRATISWIARAAAAGADSTLVLTPHYYKPEISRDLLTRYFRDVADAAELDVYLYTMPAFTGVTLPADLSAELAVHERIAGLKDSSGDAAAVFEVVGRAPLDFEVFNGSARAVFPCLSAGAAGSILAIASVAPELAVAVHRAYDAGDVALARAHAARLSRLSARLSPLGIGGLKAAMTARGYCGGVPRQPLGFDPLATSAVRSALAEAELL